MKPTRCLFEVRATRHGQHVASEYRDGVTLANVDVIRAEIAAAHGVQPYLVKCFLA